MDQEPWGASSLVNDFYFSSPPSAALLTLSLTAPSVLRLGPAEQLWS